MDTPEKILILEHDPNDIELLQYELKKGLSAFKSEVVDNREDFENALRDFDPGIILSDYSLPTFDGLKAFELAKKIRPETPFIFVSGTIGEENAVELIKSGATDYVLKEKIYQVVPKLQRALREKRNKDQITEAVNKLIQSEKELRKSEAIFKKAQQIAHCGSWYVNFETFEIIWSDEAYRIFGLDPGEMVASLESFHSFVHPEDLDRVKTQLEESEKDKAPRSYHFRIIRKDGEIRYIYSESRYEADEQGNYLMLYGIMLDITRQKLTEFTLINEERKYHELFNMSPIPMWVYDMKGLKFLQVNQAATAHYGYSEEEFFSMTLKDIRPKEELSNLESMLQPEMRAFNKVLVRHKKKDGDIIDVEIRSNPVEFEGKKARLVLAADITSLLKYMREVESHNRKLREISWMQSHVVRAPVSRILGLIDLLRNAESAEIQDEVLGYIYDSAKELDVVIHDIVKRTQETTPEEGGKGMDMGMEPFE